MSDIKSDFPAQSNGKPVRDLRTVFQELCHAINAQKKSERTAIGSLGEPLIAAPTNGPVTNLSSADQKLPNAIMDGEGGLDVALEKIFGGRSCLDHSSYKQHLRLISSRRLGR